MDDLPLRGASELAALLAGKQLSALELVDYFIRRIETYDNQLNAVVCRQFDSALAAATAADKALSRGDRLGPLHGVPITVKEALDVEGLATTWGLPPLKDNIAHRDAEVVRRLRDSGAIVLGKTNVPTALADAQTTNPLYGLTRNPWRLDCTPGGSSGGSAAATAACFSAFEVGSDMGGSIRVPAAFCGVFGHKPSWGIVPDRGHGLPGMIAPTDLGVIGPISRCADDLALALDVMAGPQSLDTPGWQLALPRDALQSPEQLRVAIWTDDPLAPVSKEISVTLETLGKSLEQAGATISYEARPEIDFEDNFHIQQYLMGALTGVGLGPEEFIEAQRLAGGIPDADQSCLAGAARSRVISHREWLLLNNRREANRYVWREFFQNWDVLLCPTYATVAFGHDDRPIEARSHCVDGQQQEYFQPMFWAGLATASYLPATVFPAGSSEHGLPIGLQVVGAQYRDHLTIQAAKLMARCAGHEISLPPL
jgi:amidase